LHRADAFVSPESQWFVNSGIPLYSSTAYGKVFN
jgi:hypothetical protein